MAFNSIENTTSFSGSDITVVAYRGLEDPTTRFALDQAVADRKRLEGEAADLKFEANYYIQEKDTALRNAEYEKQFRFTVDPENPMGGLKHDRAAEGRYQNFMGQVNHLDPFIKETKEKRNGVETATTAALEKEKALKSIPYFTLGSIHTVSYSSFREKFAVRSLGRTQAKAYTRGPRTVAGTLVFNVIQEHELLKLLGDANAGALDRTGVTHPEAVMLDQVQPFNLMLLFANEYGEYSTMHLFNIDLSSEGQEMSVDSIVTHNTMNFYATDMIPLKSLGSNWENYDQMINGEVGKAIDGAGGLSQGLGLRDKSKVDGKSKTNGMKAMLAQSRGLF